MSLILEALRKSEAERQRGRAPGLFVEQVPGRASGSRTAPAWAWGLGVLVVVLLAVLAWREWGRGTVAEPAAPAATGQPSTLVASPAEAGPPPAVTRPQVNAPQPSVAPPPTAAPAPPPPAATAPATLPVAPDAARAPTPSPRPEAPALPSPSPAPVPAPAPTASAAPPPTSAEPANPTLPTLASLDPAERSQLPPLRLSMHVYAEDPAQRFVILDGQRLGEGASPAPGLVLAQIRSDGLVLSVNGQRLLLPRP